MTEKHFYEPAHGHGLAHDPWNAIVGPRPIGWISSRAANGTANLAPYSYFNAVSHKPPMIVFSSSGRKDTLRNVEETGEFGWNLVSRAIAEKMNITSTPAPSEVSEFAVAGLAETRARMIGAPLVAEALVCFECKCADIFRLRDASGRPAENWLVVGEVVGVHIAREMLRDGVYDTAEARPVLRAGGTADYFEIRPDAWFQMKRPGWPLEK